MTRADSKGFISAAVTFFFVCASVLVLAAVFCVGTHGAQAEILSTLLR